MCPLAAVNWVVPSAIGAQEAGMGMKKAVGSLLQTLAGGERNVL